ncbi:hypothetical protein C5167_017773 [Papaver somniferum]|uniref:Chalcone/stilbene synthase C-terminal domain-containing protein n=1 Tax=Papaver somniferum TaxID=3469 RepID=A0A4Y7IPD6_PAPSO|nr:hypothetical protein C5167_017773 [Papaver somniferum]
MSKRFLRLIYRMMRIKNKGDVLNEIRLNILVGNRQFLLQVLLSDRDKKVCLALMGSRGPYLTSFDILGAQHIIMNMWDVRWDVPNAPYNDSFGLGLPMSHASMVGLKARDISRRKSYKKVSQPDTRQQLDWFVLPISEELLFFSTLVMKKLFNNKLKPYIPDFKLVLDHFCIHAGGRAVIDELEKNIQLLPLHLEASRMTLHRFGNPSLSSIWYELAYIDAKGRMKCKAISKRSLGRLR